MMRLFLIVAFVLQCSGILGQEIKEHRQFRFIDIKYHTGSHYYSGEKLNDVLSNGYNAIEVRYGWQSNNREGWQGAWLYPAYGFGWYSGFIGDPNVLGTPGALYGFISFPVVQFKRHRIVIEPAVGLSYDLYPYDSDKNANNDAIGSRTNVYFNLNVGGVYHFNRELDIIYGFDLTHFSNGRMKKPNKGLNMVGPNLGIRYNFNRFQRRIDNSHIPDIILDVRPEVQPRESEKIKKGHFLFYAAGGIVQDDADIGKNKHSGTLTMTAEYQYVYTEKSAFTGGLDFFYDWSLKNKYPGRSYDFPAVHIGYDLTFWQLMLRMQVGTYLSKKGHDFKGSYFIRPALLFEFAKPVYFQLGLKTENGFIADWVEFGFGVKI